MRHAGETARNPDHVQTSEAASVAGQSRRLSRATKALVERRVSTVRRWITDEGVAVEEAVARLRGAYGLGRRQALRYWVRAYVALLSPEDRRRRDRGLRPRDPHARFRPWPSLSIADPATTTR